MSLFEKRHSSYRAKHALFGLESSEATKCFIPLQCSAGSLRCSRHTGSSYESQACKGRTHINGIYPLGLATLDWHGQAPRACRGGGEHSTRLKLDPSGLATYVLALLSPRACRGGVIRRTDKARRAGRRRSQKHEESDMIDKNI
jgi:hypothetical protein